MVPDDLWDRVQGIRNPDWRLLRSARVYAWPLSGLVTCTCGWSMAGVAGGRQGHRVRYYACTHPRFHPLDARPSVRADYAERWFVAQLTDLAASPQLVADASARTQKTPPRCVGRCPRSARAWDTPWRWGETGRAPGAHFLSGFQPRRAIRAKFASRLVLADAFEPGARS